MEVLIALGIFITVLVGSGGVFKVWRSKRIALPEQTEEDIAEEGVDKESGPYRKAAFVAQERVIVEVENNPEPDPLNKLLKSRILANKKTEGLFTAKKARVLTNKQRHRILNELKLNQKDIWDNEVLPKIKEATLFGLTEAAILDLPKLKADIMMELAQQLGYEVTNLADKGFILKW